MAKLSLSNRSYNPKGYKSATKLNGNQSSRTDRNGNTTYYKNKSDVPGYNDNGKFTASDGSVYDNREMAKAQNLRLKAISLDKLTPATPVNVPEKPTPYDPGATFGVGEVQQGTTEPAAPQDNYKNIFTWAQQMADANFNELGSAERDYQKIEKESGLRDYQKQVNDLSGQINAIAAKRDADILRVEGQGRGIPEVIIGGQQAQINREAAIAALPIQAQLSAAQGNLAMAQQHVDKMFELRRQDANQRYQYKTNLLNSVVQFANATEDRRIAAINKQLDRDWETQKFNIGIANEWAKTAIDYGQSGLASQMMGLDPTSKTFGIDFAMLQRKLSKPVAPKEAKAPDLQNFGSSDKPQWRQWNPTTGAWENVSGISEQSGVDEKQAAADQAAGTLSLINKLKTSPGLNSAVGSNKLGRIGLWDNVTGSKDDFLADVSRLTSQETLNQLLSLKAKGGSLGALSDTEIGLLQGSASSIANRAIVKDGRVVGYDMSEGAFKEELIRIEELVNKAQKAVTGVDMKVIQTNLQPDEIEDINFYTSTANSTSSFNVDGYWK